jgi:hypothetical protein
MAFSATPLLVREYLFQRDPPGRTRPRVTDLPRIQQFDQRRPGNTQEIRSLPCGQLLVTGTTATPGHRDHLTAALQPGNHHILCSGLDPAAQQRPGAGQQPIQSRVVERVQLRPVTTTGAASPTTVPRGARTPPRSADGRRSDGQVGVRGRIETRVGGLLARAGNRCNWVRFTNEQMACRYLFG